MVNRGEDLFAHELAQVVVLGLVRRDLVPSGGVLQVALADLLESRDELCERFAIAAQEPGLGFLDLGEIPLALFLGHVDLAGELLRVDDDAVDSGRHLERVVLHVLAGAAEDGMQKLLLRRELVLALGRHFSDEDVAGLDEPGCRPGRCRPRRDS